MHAVLSCHCQVDRLPHVRGELKVKARAGTHRSGSLLDVGNLMRKTASNSRRGIGHGHDATRLIRLVDHLHRGSIMGRGIRRRQGKTGVGATAGGNDRCRAVGDAGQRVEGNIRLEAWRDGQIRHSQTGEVGVGVSCEAGWGLGL